MAFKPVLLPFPLLSALGLYIFLFSSESARVGQFIRHVQTAGHYDSPTHPAHLSHYTHTALDAAFSFIVPFFYPFCSGEDPVARLYALYFLLGNLPAFLVLWNIEAFRKSTPGMLRFPGVWGMVVQTVGFCGVSPMYAFWHLLRTPARPSPVSAVDLSALLNATFVGVMLPTIGMLLPAGSLTSELRQQLIAIWQPVPLLLSLLSYLFSQVFRLFTPSSQSATGRMPQPYAFLFLLGAATHAYTLSHVLTSADPVEFLTRLFVPRTFGTSTNLAEVAFLMIQWDLIIGSIAMVLWAGLCVWPLMAGGLWRALGLLVVLTGGCVLVSPGATCVAAMTWRETNLREVEQRGNKQRRD